MRLFSLVPMIIREDPLSICCLPVQKMKVFPEKKFFAVKKNVHLCDFGHFGVFDNNCKKTEKKVKAVN